jgi:hypothetical protein
MQQEKGFKLSDVNDQIDSKGNPLQMTNERLDKAKKMLSVKDVGEEIIQNQIGNKIKEKVADFKNGVDKNNSDTISEWRDDLMVLIEVYHRVTNSDSLIEEFIKQLSGKERCDASEFFENISPVFQDIGLSNIAIGNFTKQENGSISITKNFNNIELNALDVVKVTRPEPQGLWQWIKYKIFGDSASERRVEIEGQIPDGKKVSSFSVRESGLFGLYSHYVTYTEENGKYYKVDTMPLIGGKSEISKDEFDEKMGRASIVQFVPSGKVCSGCDALFKNDGKECYMNTVLTMLLNSGSINSKAVKESKGNEIEIVPEQVQNKELGQQEITTACCREKINPEITKHCYDCCKGSSETQIYDNATCYYIAHAYNVSQQGGCLFGSMFDGAKPIDGIPVNRRI